MKRAFQDDAEAQLKEGIVEKVPEGEADGKGIFYFPHKPIVIRDSDDKSANSV